MKSCCLKLHSSPLFQILIVSLFLITIRKNVNATKPIVSWFYRTKYCPNNTVLTYNSGDFFIATCSGLSQHNLGGTAPLNLNPAFAITKNAPLTSFTLTSAMAGLLPGLVLNATSPAVVVIDSVNGPAKGYDHFVTNVIFPYGTVGKFQRGMLHLFVPFLRGTDQGSYYCNYIDGFGVSKYSNDSGALTLSVATKSKAVRSARKSKGNSHYYYMLFSMSSLKYFF